jgi:hypothetical protein
MQYAGILLSLIVYAGLCASISRIFRRTGHASVWRIASFLPFAIVAFAYSAEIVLRVEAMRPILSLVVLVYLGLLLLLAFKPWPLTRANA